MTAPSIQELTGTLEAYRAHYLDYFDIVGENVTDSVDSQQALETFRRARYLEAAIPLQEELNFKQIMTAVLKLRDPRFPPDREIARKIQASTIFSLRHCPHYIVGCFNRRKESDLLLAPGVQLPYEKEALRVWTFNRKRLSEALDNVSQAESRYYTAKDLETMAAPSRLRGNKHTILLDELDPNCITADREFYSIPNKIRGAIYSALPLKDNYLYVKRSRTIFDRLSNDDYKRFDVAHHLAELVTRFGVIDEVLKDISQLTIPEITVEDPY